MRYKLTVPARINLLGNPGDANEGDFAVISLAVDLRAGAIVEEAEDIVLEAWSAAPDGNPELKQTFLRDQLPLPYNGQLDLVKGAINRLYQHSPEFREKLSYRGIRLAVWTEVPRQSGLGGSSLLVLLALAAVRVLYELAPHRHNDYILAELAQRVEEKELRIACGFADRYAPLFGGIGYLDHRGKLFHREFAEEPFVTFEQLHSWVEELPLILISTGIRHDSGDVHGRMRPQYLREYRQWRDGGGEMPPMVTFMTGAWETAWRGKIALLQRDWVTLGRLMNQNHHLVNEMMRYCGFPDGAGWANNLCIDTALQNGALGAKLTGAGGGGSVFALTRPGESQAVLAAWEKAIETYQLSDAKIYQPRLERQGLRVERL